MKKISLFISVLFLIGCGEKIYTVEEFEKDEKLMSDFLQKCKNGELHREDLNCINVIKANENIAIQKDIRPMKPWN